MQINIQDSILINLLGYSYKIINTKGDSNFLTDNKIHFNQNTSFNVNTQFDNNINISKKIKTCLIFKNLYWFRPNSQSLKSRL